MKRNRIKTKFGIYLPGEVQIGAVTYTVKDAPLRGKRTLGETRPMQLLIVIDVAKHASAADMMQTYTHEVDHAIEGETGVGRPERQLNAEAHMRTQALVAFVMAQ